MNEDVCVVVPVYNEGKMIGRTLRGLLREFPFVVCVEDGSRDNSAAEILKTKARLVRHPINLGQGAAIQTGIDFGLQYAQLKYFITFDADGQHSVADAARMLKHLRDHAELDVVLGSRFLAKDEENHGGRVAAPQKGDVPPLRKVILRLAVYFSNFTTGLRLSDAHNGLRVFNRRVAERLNITMPDMAHASEIVQRIAEAKFAYAELPVTIAYTDYSKAKGQSTLNAVNIIFDMLLQKVAKK